MNDVQSVEVC